jgi:hypothetical protein
MKNIKIICTYRRRAPQSSIGRRLFCLSDLELTDNRLGATPLDVKAKLLLCELNEAIVVEGFVYVSVLRVACRKLHQDPRINSNFPRFFPKTICAGSRSRDPGAYPCQAATLVSTKPLEFLLSILIHHFFSCQTIVLHIPSQMEHFYGLILDIVQCMFTCHIV